MQSSSSVHMQAPSKTNWPKMQPLRLFSSGETFLSQRWFPNLAYHSPIASRASVLGCVSMRCTGQSPSSNSFTLMALSSNVPLKVSALLMCSKHTWYRGDSGPLFPFIKNGKGCLRWKSFTLRSLALELALSYLSFISEVERKYSRVNDRFKG